MGIRIIKLPDVGEGVAEAELVEWHVEVGQSVLEDQLLAAVMTDKATVEIPSPVAGKVLLITPATQGLRCATSCLMTAVPVASGVLRAPVQ